jgi:hypothetical protein
MADYYDSLMTQGATFNISKKHKTYPVDRKENIAYIPQTNFTVSDGADVIRE